MKKNTKILIGILILALIGGGVFYGISEMGEGKARKTKKIELKKDLNYVYTIEEPQLKKKMYIDSKKLDKEVTGDKINSPQGYLLYLEEEKEEPQLKKKMYIDSKKLDKKSRLSKEAKQKVAKKKADTEEDTDEESDEELKYIQDYQLDQLNSFINDIIKNPDAYIKRGEFEEPIALDEDLIAILMIEDQISSILINQENIQDILIDDFYTKNIEDIIRNIDIYEILSIGYVHAAIDDQAYLVPDGSEVVAGGQALGTAVILTQNSEGETATVMTTGPHDNGTYSDPQNGDVVTRGTGTNNGENSGAISTYYEGVWYPTGDNDIDNNGISNDDDNDDDGDRIPDDLDNDDDNDGVFDGADPVPDNPHQGGYSQGTDQFGATAPSNGDMDGDGITNSEDLDIDGDEIPNNEDDDIDGDNIPNSEDDDDDGDGIPDGDDSTSGGNQEEGSSSNNEDDEDDEDNENSIMADPAPPPPCVPRTYHECQPDDDDDSIPNSYSNLEDLLIFINVEDLENHIFTNEVISLDILNQIPSFSF